MIKELRNKWKVSDTMLGWVMDEAAVHLASPLGGFQMHAISPISGFIVAEARIRQDGATERGGQDRSQDAGGKNCPPIDMTTTSSRLSLFWALLMSTCS